MTASDIVESNGGQAESEQSVCGASRREVEGERAGDAARRDRGTWMAVFLGHEQVRCEARRGTHVMSHPYPALHTLVSVQLFAETMSFGLRLRERAIDANNSKKSKILRGPFGPLAGVLLRTLRPYCIIRKSYCVLQYPLQA